MIDWDRVATLREEIGAEDFDEVVDLFLAEVEGTIAQMANAPGNPVVVMEQLHFLKGAALNLGFKALSELCQQGEAAARNGETATRQAEAVPGCYAESKRIFLRDLPLRFAA